MKIAKKQHMKRKVKDFSNYKGGLQAISSELKDREFKTVNDHQVPDIMNGRENYIVTY